MSRLADDYKKLLVSLLPKGDFFSKENNSIIVEMKEAEAQEFARIDSRANDLITERQVQLTTELITEHESDYGLPLEGDTLATTIEKRRDDLYSSLVRVGQQNKEYFEEIADALGYTIEIEEYTPFWMNVGVMGDSVGDQFLLFYWTVLIDATLITESIDVNISKLITKITDVKPAHTTVLFDWYNICFDRGFGPGFSRKPYYDNSWRFGEFGRGFDNGFANAYDYDGVNYVGGFDYGFSIGFDRYSGGGFFKDEFDSGFRRPS